MSVTGGGLEVFVVDHSSVFTTSSILNAGESVALPGVCGARTLAPGSQISFVLLLFVEYCPRVFRNVEDFNHGKSHAE